MWSFLVFQNPQSTRDPLDLATVNWIVHWVELDLDIPVSHRKFTSNGDFGKDITNFPFIAVFMSIVLKKDEKRKRIQDI